MTNFQYEYHMGQEHYSDFILQPPSQAQYLRNRQDYWRMVDIPNANINNNPELKSEDSAQKTDALPDNKQGSGEGHDYQQAPMPEVLQHKEQLDGLEPQNHLAKNYDSNFHENYGINHLGIFGKNKSELATRMIPSGSELSVDNKKVSIVKNQEPKSYYKLKASINRTGSNSNIRNSPTTNLNKTMLNSTDTTLSGRTRPKTSSVANLTKYKKSIIS